MLINQGGETAKYGLVVAAFDADSLGGGLDQKVSHQLIERIRARLDLNIGGMLVHLERQTVGAWKVVAVADQKGARLLVLEQIDRLISRYLGFVPKILRGFD